MKINPGLTSLKLWTMKVHPLEIEEKLAVATDLPHEAKIAEKAYHAGRKEVFEYLIKNNQNVPNLEEAKMMTQHFDELGEVVKSQAARTNSGHPSLLKAMYTQQGQNAVAKLKTITKSPIIGHVADYDSSEMMKILRKTARHQATLTQVLNPQIPKKQIQQYFEHIVVPITTKVFALTDYKFSPKKGLK